MTTNFVYKKKRYWAFKLSVKSFIDTKGKKTTIDKCTVSLLDSANAPVYKKTQTRLLVCVLTVVIRWLQHTPPSAGKVMECFGPCHVSPVNQIFSL